MPIKTSEKNLVSACPVCGPSVWWFTLHVAGSMREITLTGTQKGLTTTPSCWRKNELSDCPQLLADKDCNGDTCTRVGRRHIIDAKTCKCAKCLLASTNEKCPTLAMHGVGPSTTNFTLGAYQAGDLHWSPFAIATYGPNHTKAVIASDLNLQHQNTGSGGLKEFGNATGMIFSTNLTGLCVCGHLYFS